MKEKLLTTKNLALMGMFGALAGVLMVFEFPVPFIAPSFYGIDFSEVPVLVGTFIMGPAAGVITEAVKILVKLVIKPTSTGFVGEFANFVISSSMVLPAGIIYKHNKTKRMALVSLAAGTLSMAIIGIAANALVMIPFYSRFMPLDTIIAMGAAINPAIGSVWSFALLSVGPFNLFKGILVSIVTFLVYKRISRFIHNLASKDGTEDRRES